MPKIKRATPSEILRERIARALEAGSPRLLDGSPLSRLDLLSGDGASLPAMGLLYDERSDALIAAPFKNAWGAPFFIPFDFDRAHRQGKDRGERAFVVGHMIEMAALLRRGGLPTVSEAIAERTACRSRAADCWHGGLAY